MTTAPSLWPMVVCLFAILFASMLLFATTMLEHVIASAAFNREVPRRQTAHVPFNGKER